MHPLRNRPLPVRRFARYAALTSWRGVRVYHGYSVEERSHAIDDWKKSADTIFVLVSTQDDYAITLSTDSQTTTLPSRAQRDHLAYWSQVPEKTIVIDITGLSHSVWAILLRGALDAAKQVYVVYAEPGEYSRSQSPTEGQIFDLSEKIEGIRPIPGFASLAETTEKRVCVPLLGFEGTRFKHLLTVLEPASDRVIPIIGVPGFELEYPFHAYRGNRVPLLDSGAWKECRFAAASCPFSALYALQDVQDSLDPSVPLAVAPIGTKPHALGAILFYLTSPRPVEIVYDHPIRSRGRSKSSTTVSVYNLTGLELHSSKRASALSPT